MGLRGPVSKPVEPRGGLDHSEPERPKGMPAAARRVWDEYVRQLSGSLRVVDGFALRRLCEDVALLDELQSGMRKLASQMKRDAKASTLPMPGGPMLALAKTHEGRRITATINSLAARVARQELQFGLTPASAGRVEGGIGLPMAPVGPGDSIEAALCG